MRLRRTASPVENRGGVSSTAPPNASASFDRSCLSQSSLVDVPTLVGWIRPAIVVPASVLTGLTPAQLDAILTHELAHIRRHDYLVNLFQSAVETLLFYHPAVWWLSRRIRIERELCCDDIVVAVCDDRMRLRSRARLAGRAARCGAPAAWRGGDRRQSSRPGAADPGAGRDRRLAFVGLERPRGRRRRRADALRRRRRGDGDFAEPRPSADIALAAPERPRDVMQFAARRRAAAPLPQVQAPADAAKDRGGGSRGSRNSSAWRRSKRTSRRSIGCWTMRSWRRTRTATCGTRTRRSTCGERFASNC